MKRAAAVLLVAVGLIACGQPAQSSGIASGSAASSSLAASPEPSPEPPAASPFDFARTAWRVETIDGQPVAVGTAPTMSFDAREGASGSGAAFSGCSAFGFQWAMDGGRAQLRPQGVDLGTCSGIAGQVETAFLARLVGATTYSTSGDLLTIAGPPGQIQLRRDAPPAGDAGRAVLDVLRSGQWRVLTAPGIAAGAGPRGIQFGDTRLIAVGDCGFGGVFRMLPGGGVKFEEIYWDTVGGDGTDPCGTARDVLKGLLESATTARIGADGATVIISGPTGDVVLGR
jgi:heat shock protein HslJ